MQVVETNINTIFQKLNTTNGLLSVAQVCEFLGCHPKTLYDWTRQGRIASFRMGRTFRYDAADVYDFLSKRRIGRPRKAGVQ